LLRGASTVGVIVIGQVILLALGVMVTTPGVSPQADTQGSAVLDDVAVAVAVDGAGRSRMMLA
jgi:hypothetical protein